MALRAVGPCAGEPSLQDVQLMHLVDLELLPSMRRAASTLAADLKAEEELDAMLDAVIVRLDGPGSSDSVDELNETFVDDRADEIVIHCVTASRCPELTVADLD